MHSKLGIFSVFLFAIIFLIPASSFPFANSQEYYDEQDLYYSYEDEQYKKADKKNYNEQYKIEDERKSYYNDNDKQYKNDDKSDEPLIIIKNESIVKKEKKKMMEEPPMLIVKMYCIVILSVESVINVALTQYRPQTVRDGYKHVLRIIKYAII